MSKIFCGAKEVPEGKRRGTEQECIKLNQIRYYGVKKLKGDVFETQQKNKANELILKNFDKESAKLQTMISKGKKIINEIKTNRVVLDNPKLTDKEKKKYNKLVDALLAKRDKLVPKIKAQQLKVNTLKIAVDSLRRAERESGSGIRKCRRCGGYR